MIERKFVAQKLKEFQVQEYISKNLRGVGHSRTKLQKTPLGEKIIIFASRPGLVVGRKGQNIKKLTENLKKKFNFENPQIEINEVENINLDSQVVAERIANTMERFGSTKFKGVGHKAMTDTLSAGALGIEIVISGKVPSSRAKNWRFYMGYLKKSGDVALMHVKTAYAQAKLKSGVVGVKVRIMPPDIVLPDDIELTKEKEEIIEEIKPEEAEKKKEVKKEKAEKKDTEKKDTEKKDTEKKDTGGAKKEKKEKPEKKKQEKKNVKKKQTKKKEAKK